MHREWLNPRVTSSLSNVSIVILQSVSFVEKSRYETNDVTLVFSAPFSKLCKRNFLLSWQSQKLQKKSTCEDFLFDK
jgi:hypothetical protein